jgi:hypothetical protein
MNELTDEEKALILQALDLMFQAGAVRGGADYVHRILAIVRDIQAKLTPSPARDINHRQIISKLKEKVGPQAD